MTETFLFIRHGETDYNRRHVRCGGDVDIPLTAAGEEQAQQAGRLLGRDYPGIDAILASPLQRTRRTAALVWAELAAEVPLMLHEGLIERRLGTWNGLSIDATQAELAAGVTPPGGEGEAEFRARVAATLTDILGRRHRLPLLVGSKGVGRVIGLLLGTARGTPVGNAEVLRFEVRATRWDAAAPAIAVSP